jgi:GDP-4-dehydro-6-deoxy-D-mannose reductase
MSSSQKKVIITGINGFVGEHVADVFIQKGFDTIGLAFDTTPNSKVAPKLTNYISCNLLDFAAIQEINFADVTAIIHLAGLSAVGQSFEQPHRYIADNALMTYNLLETARSSGFSGRAVIVSTGALYDPRQRLPLIETSNTLENSPYAVGKLAVEHVANYFRLRGLDAVTVRPFNHIGPGQGEGFLVPDLFSQLAAAKSKGNISISVGDLSTKRDYTDVRDIARAYFHVAHNNTLSHTLYNICSGISVSGKEILDLLKTSMKIDHVNVSVDQSKFRPNDIQDIYGDASLLMNDTGWKPSINIATTIQDFVNEKKND